MKARASLVLCGLLASCEAAPDEARSTSSASHEVIDADEAARLAVKVANGVATAAERARLETFLNSKE